MATKTKKINVDARIGQCVSIGLKWDDLNSSYLKDDINIHITEIKTMNDAEWDALMVKLVAELKSRGQLAQDFPNDLPFTEAEEVEDAGKSVEISKRNAETDIVKFDMNEAAIAAWKEQWGGITIASLEDKENIKKAQEGKKFIRSKRTGLEAKRKALKEFYITEGKKIDEAAKKYEGLIADIEEPLDIQLANLKEWEEAEATRKENEAQAELKRRVALLQEAGLAFDGSFYSIGENISMDVVTIKSMDELSFEALVAKVGFEKNRIEDNRRAEEERQREAAEQLRQSRLQLRSTVATSIGLTYSETEVNGGAGYYYPNVIAWGMDSVTDTDDATFSAKVSEASQKIQAAKQEAQDAANRQAQEAKDQARRAMLNMRELTCKGIGLVFIAHHLDLNEPAYCFKNDFIDITIAKSNIGAVSDEEFARQMEQYAPQINTAKDQQAEKNRKEEAEKQRQEAEQRQKDEEAAKEKQRLQDQYMQRASEIMAFGFKLSDGSNLVKANNYGDRYEVAAITVRDIKDGAWEALFETIVENAQRIDNATEAKLLEIKQQAEARKPQAQRLSDYMADILNVEKPTIEDPAIREVLTILSGDIAGAIQQAINNLKKFQ